MGKYWDSFGYEWSKWHNTQDDYMENMRTFIDKTGLNIKDVRGKTVLDIGCGTGRFMEVVSRWGAKWVLGVDPSEASYVAQDKVRHLKNTSVFKAALEDEEWIRCISYHEGFDIVYCIGVLHHTPNPYESFKKIAKLVKPGGTLHVWVYKRMDYWSKITDVYRVITTRLPWWLLRIICQLAGPWEYVRRVPIIGPYVWLVFPCSMHPKWECRVLDQFDWLSPKYQWQHTTEEVMTWFVDCGFINVTTCSVPISVKGVKNG